MADFGVRLYNFEERAWSRKKSQFDVDYWGVDWAGSWLGDEVILTAEWILQQGSGLSIAETKIDSGHCTNAQFSGGNIGEWLVSIKITTPTRQREEKFVLIVN